LNILTTRAQGEEMERYLLEHHSLALEDIRGEGEGARLRAMLAENWDAPIVITTSVQFLESLFSNSPAACRKLHRLARSVVIFLHPGYAVDFQSQLFSVMSFDEHSTPTIGPRARCAVLLYIGCAPLSKDSPAWRVYLSQPVNSHSLPRSKAYPADP
jgi:hypothetical protein